MGRHAFKSTNKSPDIPFSYWGVSITGGISVSSFYLGQLVLISRLTSWPPRLLHNAKRKKRWRHTETQTSDIMTELFDLHKYVEILFFLFSIWRKEGRKTLWFSRQAVQSGADRTAALLPGGCDSFPTTVQWQCMTSTDPDRTRFTSAGLN